MWRTYRITLEDRLDPSWSAWLAGFTILNLRTGGTLVIGSLPDQAALRGLLARLFDLNLTLVAVESVPERVQTNDHKDWEGEAA
jgi:hypothetical protein